MLLRSLFLILIFFHAGRVSSHTGYFPEENASLSSVIVLLECPKQPGAVRYVFRVASTRIKDHRAFRRMVSMSDTSDANSLLVRIPEFDKEYSWMVETYDKKHEKISESALKHFSVRSSAMNRLCRVRVLENHYPDDSLFFFLDASSTMYSLDGTPVWNVKLEGDGPRSEIAKIDLRLSPQSKVTCIAADRCIEIDYYGRTIWSSPPDSSMRFGFHHEFRKLNNGNYMTLGLDVRRKQVPGDMLRKGDSLMQAVNYDVLREFDSMGNIVWEWKSEDYFSDREIFTKRNKDGMLSTRTNLNSFCVDEVRGAVYASFRHINRIVKISYPGKKILAEYNGSKAIGPAGFLKQHSVNINADGDLYFFNNGNGRQVEIPSIETNVRDNELDTISSVVVLAAQKDEPGYYKKWEFRCDIDNEARTSSNRAGSVNQLPDGNYFVCMGNTPRIFIVNHDKEILYNAVIEQWNEAEKEWQPFPSYRANPVSRSELFKLISSSGK